MMGAKAQGSPDGDAREAPMQGHSTGVRLALKYDLRAPDFAASPDALYQTCIEQCETADGWGFERAFFAEHHGSEDRYCPAPVTIAAAVASRTRRLRLSPAALLAPLHHPLRVAEELAVLDLISQGRVDVIIGAGYVPEEFAMFGADLSARGKAVSRLVATLKQAWTGEPFDFEGATRRVTPAPHASPRPEIWLGGMSRAAALRAAREADGFWPINASLVEDYLEERRHLGLPPGSTAPPGYAVVPFESPRFIHVTEDPDRDWPRVLPYAVHEVARYSSMLADAPSAARSNVASAYTKSATTDEEVRSGGSYMVLTPDQCIDMYRPLARAGGMVVLHPLLSGLDPSLSWSSLTLFADKVMPALRAED
jgi:alkanesulfonate monooxygenase SsuD/methylene tetrahydromethanopterin reductase-like flavin-dependent oxidoreductase (luciferase family)